MANVFQPDLNPDIRYEQPVDNPSVLGGLFNAASNLIQGSAGRGSGSTKKTDDKNLALFSDQVSKIQKVREEKGEVAAAILERQLAANFAATGQEFDEDFKAVYETQTGRPWDYYSRDQETRLRQDVLFNDPLYQSGYMASYALPESANFSEEERIQFASQYVAEQKAAEVLLQRSMKNGQIQWSTGTAEAFSIKRKAVTDVTWGLLSQASQRGEVVSSEDFAQARTQWESFKTSFGRPEGVTDDQWKSEQYARDQVDQAFSNMEKIIGSPELTRRMTETLQRLAIEEGMDPLLTISIPNIDFQTMMTTSEDLRTDFFNLGKMAKDGMSQAKLSDIYNTGKVGTGEPITKEDLPKNLQDVANQPPEKIWDSVLGAKTLLRGNEEALNRPEFRQQFVNGAVVMGTSLMHGNKDSFLSYDFIRSSIASPQFIANVNRLAAIDPTAGASVKAVMQSGINAEIVRQNATLSSMEWQYSVKWNGAQFVFDEDAFKSKKPNASDGELEATRKLINDTWSGNTYNQQKYVAEAMEMKKSIAALEKTSVSLNTGVVTETSNIDSNNSIINPASTTATLLDKYEGGGDYDTLFKFSNREGGPFAGVQVSTMTIGQLKAFANGEYGSWSVKQLGYKATPMGRFQFVGDTLAVTAAKMGLGDNVVFSPEIQNKMFVFLANEVISGKSQEGKRAALRGTWEGLKKASNSELDTMIAELESGQVAFGPGMTSGFGFAGEATGGSLGLTVDTPDLTPPVTFQSTRGSQGVTEGAQPSAAATLPEDVVRQSTAAPVKSQTAVPEEVKSLVENMVSRGVSEDLVLEEIERYLEERKKR